MGIDRHGYCDACGLEVRFPVREWTVASIAGLGSTRPTRPDWANRRG